MHVLPCVGRISTATRRAVPDVDADAGRAPWPPADPRTWDAEQAITVLYTAHYRSLVRAAALLTRDVGNAEEVVQEAYVGLYRRWDRLRDPEAAAGYLRQAVVNGARSVLRRRGTAERHAPVLRAVSDYTPDPAGDVVSRRAVLDALAGLPERQREVLVLRYYADLSEADIAAALGISTGAVKSYAHRGVQALRPLLTTEQGR
jgi:RNA polymerase sigma-70 factor (sigma-E family)